MPQTQNGVPYPRTDDEVRARPPSGRRWLLARLQAGLTLAEVTRRTGTSLSYLVHIEHGRQIPGPLTVKRLRDAYGMDDES